MAERPWKRTRFYVHGIQRKYLLLSLVPLIISSFLIIFLLFIVIGYLAINAGAEGATVFQRVKAESGAVGYDAQSDRYVDMVAEGIIDPTKVTRIALQNAASVAALLLTTEALITELPEERKPAMPPGGHHDMDMDY